MFRGKDVNNTNFSTESHTTNPAVWPVALHMRTAMSPGHSRSDPFSFPDHVPSSILGDPGAVSRAGRKFRQSFQAQVEEPLGTDSHRTFQMVKRILAPDCFVFWYPIGEQHLLSSFNFVSSYTTAIYSITACLEMHAVRKLKLLISKYCLPEN